MSRIDDALARARRDRQHVSDDESSAWPASGASRDGSTERLAARPIAPAYDDDGAPPDARHEALTAPRNGPLLPLLQQLDRRLSERFGTRQDDEARASAPSTRELTSGGREAAAAERAHADRDAHGLESGAGRSVFGTMVHSGIERCKSLLGSRGRRR